MAPQNPFRYRGYYYDYETGFYYLNSRYYDPATGRFITADVYISTGQGILGNNMYAYCRNNPVMRYDVGGYLDEEIMDDDPTTPVDNLGPVHTGHGSTQSSSGGGGWSGTSGYSATHSGSGHSLTTGSSWIRGNYHSSPTSSSNWVRGFSDSTINNHSACFVEGTLVATDDGMIPIEEIEVGDLVWATNEKTGEIALKEVVHLFRNETKEWIHLTANGEKITCTPNHPFYSPIKGWISAIDLRAGDILVTLNGEYIVVEQVQHELLESPQTTYNFEVEGFHTYCVGNTKVIVHNTCVDRTFVPNEYWTKNANKFGTPNTTVIHQKYNNYTGKIETSTVSYDYAGRQVIRIDWTNHGRLGHGNPHIHYTTYGRGYEEGRTVRWD